MWKNKQNNIDLSNIKEVKDPKMKDLDDKNSTDSLILPKKSDDPTFIEKQFFSQEISFVRGENKTMEISLKFMKD